MSWTQKTTLHPHCEIAEPLSALTRLPCSVRVHAQLHYFLHVYPAVALRSCEDGTEHRSQLNFQKQNTTSWCLKHAKSDVSQKGPASSTWRWQLSVFPGLGQPEMKERETEKVVNRLRNAPACVLHLWYLCSHSTARVNIWPISWKQVRGTAVYSEEKSVV